MEIEKKICIWSRSGDIGTVPNLLKNRRKLFVRSNRSCLKMTCDRATWVWCLFKFIWYNQNPFLLFQCIAICCAPFQRWANSVLMTEYEYEYYSAFQNWPNTNTNIIRASKYDRIRIRILFGSPKTTEYEYEYYSAPQKRPNTNTNIIRLSKNDRIRI